MVRMKSFKTMQGDYGKVRPGQEFEVASQNVADALEKKGHAMTLKAEAPLQNKMERTLENKAAAAGPLASPGGGTGAENALSSSPAGPAQLGSTSAKPKASPASSASTKPTGSPRGPTSSTAATGRGGSSGKASRTSKG